VVEQLRPQDGLFTVVTRAGGDASPARIIGSVRDVVGARSEPAALRTVLGAAGTRIVSMTVTEKGYAADLSTRGLDRTNPLLARDLADQAPYRSVVGKLVAAFHQRAERGLSGLTVLCCDNVTGGGDLVRQLCAQFLQHSPLGSDGALAAWVEANVRFPNTLVDRIVPETPPAAVAARGAELGYRDDGLVCAEPYGLWVIEDDFVAGHPQWPAENVHLVDDVRPWSDLKLRLVNGGHSLLAYLGLLAGHRTVAEVMAAPEFRALLVQWLDEASASLSSVPDGVDLAAYRAQVTERFANPGIAYELTKIAADGSAKLPIRIGSTAAELIIGGMPTRMSALVLAAWVAYASSDALSDAAADRIRRVLDEEPDARGQVHRLFGPDGVAPLPAVLAGDFLDDVSSALMSVRRSGGHVAEFAR
jgi:fructuronate reductase